MTAKETDSARLREKGSSLTSEPSPDMMLGLWISWMEAQSGLTPDWFSSNKPWWEVTPDKVLGKMIAGGVKALNETLAKDPLLRSADQMWNANPLREVIPVDWAEIAGAAGTSGNHGGSAQPGRLERRHRSRITSTSARCRRAKRSCTGA